MTTEAPSPPAFALGRILRRFWYRLAIIVAIVVPALLTQTALPLFATNTTEPWERWSEPVYTTLLALQNPEPSPPSRVALLQVDRDTIDNLGWPLDRERIADLLSRLKAHGHPWVLSMLRFMSVGNHFGGRLPPEEKEAQDARLEKAIADYGRYVGIGLSINQDAELDADVEETLLKRVLLSRGGGPPEDIPRLPLELVEDARFVSPQRAFGYGTRFAGEGSLHCMQFYLTDAAQRGEFVVLSSLAWAAALTLPARLITAAGATWSPDNGRQLPPLRIRYQECLPDPSWTTNRWLDYRGVTKMSFIQFLREPKPPDLSGKLVILAADDLPRVWGPGRSNNRNEAIVTEDLLVARMVDGLLSGNLIGRQPLSQKPLLGLLPLILAVLLLLASFTLSARDTALLALSVMVLLGGWAGINLWSGLWLLPIQALVATASTAIGLVALTAYLRYHGIRRQIHLTRRLNDALSTCNTLEEIETKLRGTVSAEFQQVQLALLGYDRRLYAASSDPQAALTLLQAVSASSVVEDEPLAPPVDEGGSSFSTLRRPFTALRETRAIPIASERGRLGTVSLNFAYPSWESAVIAPLLEIIRIELSQHWHRVRILAEQKLLDYRFVLEQTRGEIMERFLTAALVAKFSDTRTMEENLRLVLTPRPTRAALLQADIRGYSKVSSQMSPSDMVRLLQSYFRSVVDAAQLVAQVKLIGDCIFLFIEEEAATPAATPADLALEVAALLVRETVERNAAAQTGLPQLNFGIGLHFGEVVVGNLSSDSCIDYTVIGPNVNLVARLEELTKNSTISAAIGPNGILMSLAAHRALKRHAAFQPPTLGLETMGLSVRSFPEVKEVMGITATLVATVATESLITRRIANAS